VQTQTSLIGLDDWAASLRFGYRVRTLRQFSLRNSISKCHGHRCNGLFTVKERLVNGRGLFLEEENMKRLPRVALLVLAGVSVASAQDDHRASSQADANVAADFAHTSAASPKFADAISWRSADLRLTNATALAEPRSLAAPAEAARAAPDPNFAYGSRDDFRWQLALGVSVLRFRSSIYYATGVGTNTAVTYFTNEWLGVEGNITTGFAIPINANEHLNYVSYGAGPKIAWRSRKWEPWMHTIFGGAHILPQTGAGQSGFGLQMGGGADYRILPHLSARVGVDWVRTHLFGEWQNSGQANADIVLHF